MGRGSVFQRHTRQCPRDAAGKITAHKCRAPWTYSIVERRSDGRRRLIERSGFPTKRAAEAAMREVQARREAGFTDVHGLTVSDYLDQWLLGKRSLRETTRRGYDDYINRFLRPGLGSLVLADLRPHHVDALYQRLLEEDNGRYTAATIRHVHAVLRSALNAAVRRRLLPWNPALHVELPEWRRRETSVWGPEEVAAFLTAIRDHRLHAMFHLILVAGLRRGEALGLHWRDVDLDNGVIHVRTQLVQARETIVLGPPKTKSGARIVPVVPITVEVLRRHRAQQAAEQAAWGGAWHDSGLVFTKEDGRALRPDYASHLFRQLSDDAGLPRIRLHDLRHTNASLALAAGVSMKAVSDRLGHSSVGITADLYTHVIPAVARQAAELIAGTIPWAQTAEDQPPYGAGTEQGPPDPEEEGS